MKALGEVQIIISGGIKNGVEREGAGAGCRRRFRSATAALIALNCNAPLYVEDYEKLGVERAFVTTATTDGVPWGSRPRTLS